MQFHFHLADSEISSVESRSQSILIHFSAAQVAHSVGMNSVSGYATNVLMQLDGVHIHGKSEPLIGRIRSGTLWVEGQVRHDCPLPFTCTKTVKLEIELANHAYLQLTAVRFALSFDGEVNFHESLEC